jgi:signal peptidase I
VSREPAVRRAARAVLTRGVGGPGTVWGAAVLGEFEETTGGWEAVRWAAGGLLVAWRERWRRLGDTRTRRIAAAALVAAVAGGVVNWQAVGLMYVPSGSMSPTLRISDRVVVDRWAGVHRGDVVVLSVPEPDAAVRLYKRVIGLPGDRIACRDGQVYRDGAPLAEPYLAAGTRTDCQPVTVPPDTLYVLGDDRSVSADSRHFGPVAGSAVTGVVVLRIWPLDRLGRPAG